MNSYSDFIPQERKVAYFSFEVGLSADMPTYSGGLGILAGDTIKTFADQGVPAVALTLLNEKGYFHQVIDRFGNQQEHPVNWDFQKHMTLLKEKVTVNLEGRDILIQAWVHKVKGESGKVVPLLFLDTNIKTNNEYDQSLTKYLYGGDRRYRLMQEALLGLGGIRLLQVLDHDNLETYHMNEGHSAFLTVEMMDRYQKDIDEVRERCVFTTHTPVPAGHDMFDVNMLKSVFGDFLDYQYLIDNGIIHNDLLNMTNLALFHSRYVNGVATKHQEVTQKMFPEYDINAITNGIHVRTWVTPHMAELFDKYMPLWKADPYLLRGALGIPRNEIWHHHQKSKEDLIEFLNFHYKADFDVDTFTIGFARRATPYKRADLLFRDLEKLRSILKRYGKIQVVYGGKAHPRDGDGKAMIKKIIETARSLKGEIKFVYLNNYDIYSAKLLVGGVDLWLNTPQRPKEASGTSGMKAAVNGVLNFSVLDGWWIEGHIEDFTGWSIGPEDYTDADQSPDDSDDLYKKLNEKILPLYYTNPGKWQDMMAYNIAINGSFFNTHRMVSQYVTNAYYE